MQKPTIIENLPQLMEYVLVLTLLKSTDAGICLLLILSQTTAFSELMFSELVLLGF